MCTKLGADDLIFLTQEIAQGNDEAMGELARRCAPAMLKYAKQLLGSALRSSLDADDLVQSVLLTIWQGIRAGKFVAQTPSSLSGLARTLLRRQVARHWRELKSEAQAVQDASLADTAFDIPVMPNHRTAPLPQRQMEFDELMENFLSELTETDRALVQLRFRGFTTADAAILLQVESGHLRVRLLRLRKKFGDWHRRIEESVEN